MTNAMTLTNAILKLGDDVVLTEAYRAEQEIVEVAIYRVYDYNRNWGWHIAPVACTASYEPTLDYANARWIDAENLEIARMKYAG